nr:pilus assembly protein TadG-related protein [uncultured Duganella sp.]
MVFTLAFGVATGLVTLLLFNSGMLANTKTRLQNAADAGAYSAGVLQARDHNFSAYTNRAMIANQVAVVQLASLKSYLEDAADTHQRMDGALLSLEELLPVDKPAWNFGHSVPIESVNSAFAAVASPAVKGLDLLIKAFEGAQQAHHLATALNMTQVADEAIKRNDPGAKLTRAAFFVGRTALQVNAWRDSTQAHSANGTSAVSDRFADVVVSDKSTDDFTRNRFSSPVPKWGKTEVTLCRFMPNYVRSNTSFAFVHSGGSILSADKKRWLSLDATLGAGVQTCTFWYPCWTGICYTTETSPLFDDNIVGGSGGAVVGADGGYDGSKGYRNNPSSTANYGGALLVPGVPAQIRYYGKGPGSTLDTNGGLQDYYRDVVNPAAAKPADQTAEKNGGAWSVTLEAEHPGADIRTAAKILPDATRIHLADGMKGDTLRVLAGAQSYFYRANSDGAMFTRGGWRRGDGKTEMANLFSPYWQARLSDRSSADRAASWAAQ